MPWFLSFLRDEKGLEAMEYAVLTALIVGALITAIVLLTEAVSAKFNEVQEVVGPE